MLKACDMRRHGPVIAHCTDSERFAHMLWCVAAADVGQFSQIWSDVVRCGN